ncbi:hypothetical protein [uncultured Ornithinimicrobium sp.]|uniref:hypothetical protein n=1 Tax=uncultured Ornithinimicrobium sp. TaxID=259307 RepID=UPI00259A7E8B|nr:hypothetical protein [uncultured Ornithinimicrobium sp.]
MIVAVSALLVLSACDTTSEPSAPPTSEDALTTATAEPPPPVEDAEVTTEPEPTSDESTEEAVRMDQTEEGAQAFVEHYMDELNAARANGAVEEVSALATSDCASCQNFETTAEQGGLDPLEYEVQDVVLLGETATVSAEVTDGGQSGQVVFELLQSDAEWRVNAVQAVQ